MVNPSTVKALAEKLSSSLPRSWEGRTCILRMRDEGFPHWRQMEWIGFYFQFLCAGLLPPLMKIPGPRYGKPEFDGFCEVPWDFKAHAINTSAHQIIVNDSEAIAQAISEYGSVGLILALGEVEYNDEARSFQTWHERVKGGRSRYEEERIRRGAWSRLRKVNFTLRQVSFIEIADATLVKSGSFQSDFRNSNGRPRRAKLLIDLERLEEENIHFIDFH